MNKYTAPDRIDIALDIQRFIENNLYGFVDYRDIKEAIEILYNNHHDNENNMGLK